MPELWQQLVSMSGMFVNMRENLVSLTRELSRLLNLVWSTGIKFSLPSRTKIFGDIFFSNGKSCYCMVYVGIYLDLPRGWYSATSLQQLSVKIPNVLLQDDHRLTSQTCGSHLGHVGLSSSSMASILSKLLCLIVHLSLLWWSQDTGKHHPIDTHNVATFAQPAQVCMLTCVYAVEICAIIMLDFVIEQYWQMFGCGLYLGNISVMIAQYCCTMQCLLSLLPQVWGHQMYSHRYLVLLLKSLSS